MNLQFCSKIAFLLASSAGLAHAGVVTIAERPLQGPFATIQAGVDAALEGESLLVVAGTYAPFTIDGKSVQVFVTGAGLATISGTVSVKNIAATQFVVLTSLKVTSVIAGQNVKPALDISNVTGHVRVQDSIFKGHTGVVDSVPLITGQGVRVSSSINVVLSSCSLAGGLNGYVFGADAIDGGPALQSVNSSLAMYDCTMRGGDGSYESAPRGGNGGPACSVVGYGLFASGCSYQGGYGGGGDYVACLPGGQGGDGLVVDAAQAHLLACTTNAGGGGPNGCGGNPSGPGAPIVALNGAVVDSMLGAGRRIAAAPITSDDLSVPITINGQPGDAVYLLVARRPSFVFKKLYKGTWMVPTPYFASALPAGTVGPNGTLVVQRTFDIPDGTVQARLFWLQALCVDVAGQTTLTGPAHVLSLE